VITEKREKLERDGREGGTTKAKEKYNRCSWYNTVGRMEEQGDLCGENASYQSIVVTYGLLY
jgi:hypothetical protein